MSHLINEPPLLSYDEFILLAGGEDRLFKKTLHNETGVTYYNDEMGEELNLGVFIKFEVAVYEDFPVLATLDNLIVLEGQHSEDCVFEYAAQINDLTLYVH